MTESKDQIIYRQQQEIKSLKKKLYKEDDLWYADENADRRNKPEKSKIMHRCELLDEFIANPTMLYHTTKKNPKQFNYILKKFTHKVKADPDAPLFSDDRFYPGNRCKLHIRHVLLLIMMKEKLGISQYELMPIFGVDQSTISRYLEFARTILLEILPTAEKITKKIQNAKSIEEIKYLVPGSNGGELYIDGTHISIERPTDPDARKDYYSGKKKKHTLNITIVANRDKLVITTGKPVPGSMQDLKMFQYNNINLGPLSKSMKDKNAAKKDKVTVYVDKGYQAIEKELPGANVQKPTKKPKNAELDDTQKNKNRRISNIRIKVEHAIRLLKLYKVLIHLYVGTDAEFYRDLQVVTGLANFDLLWDERWERLKYGF